MNPAFEKASTGGDAKVPEVLMPADLRSWSNVSQPSNFQQSPQPTATTGYGPNQIYAEKIYSNPVGPQQQQPQAQRQTSQYRQAVAIPNLGMSPAPVDCPSCGRRGMTTITYQAGNTTHVWAGVTCLLTGLLCFIPYMMNSLKDVQHRCGSCGVLLATWHKSGHVDAHMHA